MTQVTQVNCYLIAKIQMQLSAHSISQINLFNPQMKNLLSMT